MRKRMLVRTCHFADLRSENYVRLSEQMQLFEPMSSVQSWIQSTSCRLEMPTNIGNQCKKSGYAAAGHLYR